MQHRPYISTATLTNTSKEKIEQVLKLYSEGLSQTKIETTLKMTRKTIRTILKNNGVDRTKSQQWRIRYQNKLDDTVFDTLNEESAYWIGFLYADGAICKSSNSIELSLSIVDKKHLEKFKKFLNSSNNIETYKSKGFNISSEMCRIRINSDKIKQKLSYYGFHNDKTITATPHKDLLYNKHFWRGVIDGDGCIHFKNNKLAIHLCGTENTIKGFIDFVKTLTNTKCNPRETKNKELYQVSFDANKAKIIIDELYKNSLIYLDRKYKLTDN